MTAIIVYSHCFNAVKLTSTYNKNYNSLTQHKEENFLVHYWSLTGVHSTPTLDSCTWIIRMTISNKIRLNFFQISRVDVKKKDNHMTIYQVDFINLYVWFVSKCIIRMPQRTSRCIFKSTKILTKFLKFQEWWTHDGLWKVSKRNPIDLR